jgi:hypothetical protein
MRGISAKKKILAAACRFKGALQLFHKAFAEAVIYIQASNTRALTVCARDGLEGNGH